MKNKSNTLCIISLICMFAMPIITFFVAGLFMNGDISGVTAAAYAIMIPLNIASYIAAWVLAIIARVKYKKTFSLVLLIIYGSLFAISIIGAIVLLLYFIGLI